VLFALKSKAPARGLAGGGNGQSVAAVLTGACDTAACGSSKIRYRMDLRKLSMCGSRFAGFPIRNPVTHLAGACPKGIPTAWDTRHGVPR